MAPRAVTFGELRRTYEVEDGFVLIGRARDQVSAPMAARTPTLAMVGAGRLRRLFRTVGGGGTTPSADLDMPAPPIRLRLGPDDACPFADAHEWAAFTVTGA
jgi:hypothetical protein